jgi:hypothetical protein
MLAVLLFLGGIAGAQISTPPPCRGAVTDREVRIKFHLRFHDGSGAFDARSVVRLRRQGPDPTCNDGDVLDLVIGELAREREQFLPPP